MESAKAASVDLASFNDSIFGAWHALCAEHPNLVDGLERSKAREFIEAYKSVLEGSGIVLCTSKKPSWSGLPEPPEIVAKWPTALMLAHAASYRDNSSPVSDYMGWEMRVMEELGIWVPEPEKDSSEPGLDEIE